MDEKGIKFEKNDLNLAVLTSAGYLYLNGTLNRSMLQWDIQSPRAGSAEKIFYPYINHTSRYGSHSS